jgi:ParB/RepB/Spo0J family partition protein
MESRDLDLHRLELRFTTSRLFEPRAIDRLVRSIERYGQVVPCVVAADDGGGAMVVIDGYRRIAALRRLGFDTVKAEIWTCSVADALIAVLARTNDRPFAAMEEALALRELVEGHGVSQHELARRCGRDVSWVSRRLQLLSGLSDGALLAVREGRLSSWAASRIVAPLARANGDHAMRLLESLAKEPLSTRELARWFKHYQSSLLGVRDHLVSRPGLFIRAQAEAGQERMTSQLREGPEGRCAADVRIIASVFKRLTRRVEDLRPAPEVVVEAAPRLQAALDGLVRIITREDGHDRDRHPRGGADPEGARGRTSRDRARPEAVPGDGETHPA